MTRQAGWYPDPEMADTRRYWDGEKWTDNFAPAERQERTGFWTITRAVVVGILIAAVVIAFVVVRQSSKSQTDCELRSIQRVADGKSALKCD